MTEYLITRRALLQAGLATGMVALVPAIGFSGTMPARDLSPIGPGARADIPYEPARAGKLSDADFGLLSAFAAWAITAWRFQGMEDYTGILADALESKTRQRPSYLAEYGSAARLIGESGQRLGSDHDAFLYCMFAGRDNENPTGTRIGRAQRFVFDEIVRHLVASGGFRRFGFTNYPGFISVSFTDPKSYRR